MTPHSTRDWIAVLWPAFIAACLTEIVVFACFDPADFHFFGSQAEWSGQSVYSLGFFCFWLIGAIATLATWNLGRSARQINDGVDAPTDASAAEP